MRKKYKKLFISLGIFLIIFSSITIYADDLKENIEVIFNSINIVVNGQKITADNIMYKDTTYVPLRTVAEMLEKEINWDSKTNTATIVEPVNDELKIVYAFPQEFSEDAFLHWGYLDLVFDKEMTRIKDIEDIYLVDCFGERMSIEKVMPGVTIKTNLLIIPKKQLKLNTNYNLFIPASTLESKEGEMYKQDVNLHFKTAYNVLQG
ncbi:stalk domain-containing protein [Brassicibacter mesophilus]|uniref:stalk domain-containing protein n=1 Tax=Brassicibacter mesophilus TaxID=745119 RepID=UPI003D1DC79C